MWTLVLLAWLALQLPVASCLAGLLVARGRIDSQTRLAHHIAVLQDLVGSHRVLQRPDRVVSHHLVAARQMTMRPII